MDKTQRNINKMLSWYTPEADLVTPNDKRLNDAFIKRTQKTQAALNTQGITGRQDTVTNRNTKSYRKMKTF